jgi:hypothetical protein
LFMVGLVIAIAAWAFWTSLGNRTLWKDEI